MRKSDPSSVAQQRERIIRGALKCFARKGIQGSSTDDICRAAGVSSGKLYYYFKSRDGLLCELINYAHASRDELLEGLKDSVSILDSLLSVDVAYSATLKDQGVSAEVFIELLAYASHNAAAKAAFQDAAERVFSIVAEAVRLHQDAGKLPNGIGAQPLARFLGAASTAIFFGRIVDENFNGEEYRDTFSMILYGRHLQPTI
jgi:TetR/AcrR family transcriptional repressor of uid operon